MSMIKKLWEEWVNKEGSDLENKDLTNLLKKVSISYNTKESIISFSSNKKTILNLITHHKDEIEAFFSVRLMKKVNLEFQPQLNVELNVEKEVVKKSKDISFGLHIDFSFKNFIVGESNKEAFLACKQFAEEDKSFFSPIFLYGGNGLGKTHLLNAAGGFLSNKGLSVAYLTSSKLYEMFNEQRSKERKGKLFQEKLKNFDVVIVDDIQLFEGKEESLLVLFDIIDHFINKKKRLAFASDQRPQDLSFFSTRLKSRLSSGLQIKIKDFDLKTAIEIVQLKLKTNSTKLKLSKEIVRFIAKNFGSDGRLIDSAIKRLDFLTLTIYDSSNINLDFVSSSLRDMMKNKSKNILANTIIEVVAKNYFIPMDMLVSTSRKSSHVLPRHVSMYLIRKLTDLSYGQIGGLFNGKDQSSISTACKKIETNRKMDNSLNEKLVFIEKTVKKMFSNDINQ